MTTPIILILGAAGQVGCDCVQVFSPIAQVHAIDRSQCDASDLATVAALVRSIKPSIIINAVAYTAVDKAETDAALAATLNTHLPETLAIEAKKLGALLVHYSTDYVFDGNKHGAYLESDTPNPQGVYGATKLAGEQAMNAVAAASVIFRLSWVFGAGKALSANNFPKTMLRLARERDALRVVADQHGTPTPSALVAHITAKYVAAWLKNPTSTQTLFHLSGGGAAAATHWHAFAQTTLNTAQQLGIKTQCLPNAVAAITTADYPTPARRPANSVMDTSKIEAWLGEPLPHWQQGLNNYLKQLAVQQ